MSFLVVSFFFCCLIQLHHCSPYAPFNSCSFVVYSLPGFCIRRMCSQSIVLSPSCPNNHTYRKPPWSVKLNSDAECVLPNVFGDVTVVRWYDSIMLQCITLPTGKQAGLYPRRCIEMSSWDTAWEAVLSVPSGYLFAKLSSLIFKTPHRK